jgi:hypothetical protein
MFFGFDHKRAEQKTTLGKVHNHATETTSTSPRPRIGDSEVENVSLEKEDIITHHIFPAVQKICSNISHAFAV